MDKMRRLKIKRDFFERSYAQWALMRSLAFGERDWIVICSVLFLLGGSRDFLTVPGATIFVLGLFFLGPIFGMMIYFTGQVIYRRRKAGNRLPATVRGFQLIACAANAICFPLILLLSWVVFDLFYESYDSLLSAVTGVFRPH